MADIRPDEKYDPLECRRLIRLAGMYQMLPNGEAMNQMARQLELMLRDMVGAEQRAKHAEDDLSMIKSGSSRESTELAKLAQDLSDAQATIESLKAGSAPAGKGKKAKKVAAAAPITPADPDAPEIHAGPSPYSRNR